jgi:DNA-binding response OmpR family regulator
MCNERELDVHLKNFELLALLIENRGTVVTKEMIHGLLWSHSQESSEGSIRVYINN